MPSAAGPGFFRALFAMLDEFRSEIITLPGSFGNREVKLSRLFPYVPNGAHVLLLHGVHSSANLSPHNKFSHLARILAERGITPWLCETSRRQVSRDDYPNNLRGWIMDAFGGKSFPDEFADCEGAFSHVALHKPRETWLWGFSLGGVIALALAAKYEVERVIMSGTGLVSAPDAERDMIPLPILSTLRENLSPDMLREIKAESATLFRGTNDAIFSDEACRDLIDAIGLPAERKKYFAIEGADHSLKMRGGRRDAKIMDEMLALLLAA